MKRIKEIREEIENINNELNTLFWYFATEKDNRVKKIFNMDINEKLIELNFCYFLLDNNYFVFLF